MSTAPHRPSSLSEFEALKQQRPRMEAPYIPVKAAFFKLKLDPYARVLYDYLFGLAASKRRNWCRLSKETLSERTGIGRTKMDAALKDLEERGLLTVWSNRSLRYTEFVVYEPFLSPRHAGIESSPREDSVPATRGLHTRARNNKCANAHITSDDGARVCQQDQLPTPLSTIPQGTLDGWAERYGAMRLLGVLVAAARIPGIKSPGGIVRTLLTDGSGLDESELLSLLRSNLARAAGAAELRALSEELQKDRAAELQVGTPGGEQRAALGPGQALQGIWQAFQARFPGQGLAWLAFWGHEPAQSQQQASVLTWVDLPRDVRQSFVGAPEEEKVRLVDWYHQHPEKLGRRAADFSRR